jgi:hypothetical protein
MTVRATLLLSLLLHQTFGQTPPTAVAGSDLLYFNLVPSRFRTLVEALGDRLDKTGRERVVLTGSLEDSSGSKAYVVTRELSGKFRLDEGAATSVYTIVFDGKGLTSSKGVPSAADNDRIESLIADSSEYFLYSVIRGRGSRLLGRRFRLDDGTDSKYTGPFFDIFELFASVPARAGFAPRPKHYYFDSASGLLQKVRYVVNNGNSNVTVETAWTGWRKVDGQATPSVVTRTENGKPVFAFRITSAAFSPALADSTFSPIGSAKP